MAHCKDEKQMNAILGCIEKANPILHRLIYMLRDELVGFDEIKKSLRELLNRAPVDVRRPYCNCLIEICIDPDQLGFPSHRPHELFHLGNVYGLYQRLETRRLSEWLVDLRRLSLGAAKAALYDWFQSVVEYGESLPPQFQFRAFTGHKLESMLTRYLEGYSSESGAPFHKCPEKVGSFVADKDDLLQWLQSRLLVSASSPQ